MRVLVATARTNGDVEGDFNFCVEGELVTIDEPCDEDRDDPDSRACGCGRAFSGLGSHGTTTTARVAELPFREADVREAIRASLLDSGGIDPDRTTHEDAERLVEEAWGLVQEVAQHFPVDTVVGRRLSRIVPRRRR